MGLGQTMRYRLLEWQRFSSFESFDSVLQFYVKQKHYATSDLHLSNGIKYCSEVAEVIPIKIVVN